ncbi:DUF6341 family protein [Mesonia aestuariivivens]|uniref:DUF6341 family protein n=1 Tax=Mesonia aestuariivivens TaxID=2796128 RepID=UPI001C55EEDB|nr:uracil phosphoribosyltransferase [Mesonia aestuariivivens]
MKDFFEFIQYIFVDILFVPLHALRKLELESWFAANTLNWVFIIIGVIAFCYWVKQLMSFSDEEKERQEKYFGKYWN